MPVKASPEEQEAARWRRLAEVFGEALPETTRDGRPRSGAVGSDDWLRAQVPPHHG